MKKILMTLVGMWCVVLSVAAQEAQIKAVKALNEQLKAIQYDFCETAYNKATNKTSTLTGTLYFTSDKRLSMKYSQPAGDLKLIADGKYTQIAHGKYMQTNIRQKGAIAHLSTMLTNSLAGDVKAIADMAAGTTVSASVVGNYYVFTIQAGKGLAGINTLTLKYDKTDGVLHYMRIDYPKGKYNIYELAGGKKTNVTPPDDVFKAPSKK